MWNVSPESGRVPILFNHLWDIHQDGFDREVAGRGAGSTIISLEGGPLSAPSSPLPRSFGSPRELQSAPSLPDQKGRRGPSLHTIPSPQLPNSSSQPTPWRRSGQERMRWWNEMVFIHHQLNGHEFERTHGDREGQGSLAFFSPQGHKEFNMT